MTPLRTLLVASLLLASSACAVRVDRYEPAVLGTQRVVQRDWESGVARTWQAGEVIASFKEGRAQRRQSGWAVAPQPFTVSSGDLVLRGAEGDRFEVRGTTEVNGREYLAIDVPTLATTYSLLLDGRGRISDRVLRGMELRTDRFTVAPAGAALDLEVIEEFDEGAPFQHRELVFAGVQDGKLVLELREYGPGGSGAPTSMSRLDFPAEPGTVEAGGWTLRVDQVSGVALEGAISADTYVQG
jgi:hypothetical protein